MGSCCDSQIQSATPKAKARDFALQVQRSRVAGLGGLRLGSGGGQKSKNVEICEEKFPVELIDRWNWIRLEWSGVDIDIDIDIDR